jgi:glycosyltransferase involved in cell wall biosynthesis
VCWVNFLTASPINIALRPETLNSMTQQSKIRLAIIGTHPVQYNAPVFAQLAATDDVDVRVFYGWTGTANSVDVGFGQRVEWDIPLLEGYDSEFLKNVAKVPGSFAYSGIDTPQLIQRVSNWKADAILVYGWCYKSHLAALRHFHGKIPVCFRGDSTMLNKNGGVKKLLRRTVLRWVYSHVDIAFSVGTHNHEYLRKHGLSGAQIVHAPHAIDNARFSLPDAEGEHIRQEMGLGEDDIAVLFPGKLEPIKQPEILLAAQQQLADPRVHLVFAGSGPLEASLKSSNVPRTHFLGFQNQSRMPAVYRMSDVVCLPSRSETWGLALNEAMACCRSDRSRSQRLGCSIRRHQGVAKCPCRCRGNES